MKHKFRAIFHDTLLEIKSGKIFYVYILVTVVVLLIVSLISRFDVSRQDITSYGIIKSEFIVRMMVGFYDGFWGFAFLLMLFGVAWHMPSYMSKGRVELVLSKPISRSSLLLLKFLSLYLIKMAIFVTMSVLIWIVVSLKAGVFWTGAGWGLLFAFLHFLVIFVIVFAISVVSRSGALAIMGYFAIRAGSDFLAKREALYDFLNDKTAESILDAVYYVSPKIGEMAANFDSLMIGQGFVNSFAIFSNIVLAVVFFALTALYFARKDF